MTARASASILAAVCTRTWIKTLRRPVVLSFSLVQPMFWMLFFGFLFTRYPLALPDEGISYITFLVPGICAMTVMFGASQSGIAFMRDMQTRFLQRMLATPADRRLILGGKLLADVIRLMVQAVVVLGIGILVGAHLSPSPGAVLVSTVSLMLFAGALSSLSCFIALRAKAPEAMSTFVHLVNMPILFTSNALVPQKNMPDWLHAISEWNPLTLAVHGLRESLLSGAMPPVLGTLVPLAVLAAGLFLLASSEMTRAARDG